MVIENRELRVRTAKRIRDHFIHKLSPFRIASMTEGSNFDFLFKVGSCILPKCRKGALRTGIHMTGRSDW